MINARFVLPLIVIAVIIGGCSSGGEVKKGDILVVKNLIQEQAETQWENNYTDRFIAALPKGTRLQVTVTPTPEAKVFECIPVEVNGEKDPDSIEAYIVPDSFRKKPDYLSYKFIFDKKYVGSKLKRAD